MGKTNDEIQTGNRFEETNLQIESEESGCTTGDLQQISEEWRDEAAFKENGRWRD